MSALTRETATILAALRFWQLAKEDAPLVIINLSIDGGRLCRMQNQEIEELCDKIQMAYCAERSLEAPTPWRVIPNPMRSDGAFVHDAKGASICPFQLLPAHAEIIVESVNIVAATRQNFR